MDRPLNLDEEATESVNIGDQGLLALDPFEYVRSESHAPAELNEALLRISHDMTRVLERLTTSKAPIDMIRRHGAEEFHGSNMEESDKAEFWLEKLQRKIEEVRYQRVACVVAPLCGPTQLADPNRFRDARLILFIYRFIKFYFSKMSRPESLAQLEWRIRTGAWFTPTIFIYLIKTFYLRHFILEFSFTRKHFKW